MPRPPHTQTTAADALLAVAPLVSRWIERLLAGHDPPLTLAQYLTLRAIAQYDISGTELARRTGVSGPAVSQVLTALSDAGLLERHASIEDRRRQALTLTATGKDAFHSAEALVSQRLSELLAELPRAEADALARGLPHVEAALSGQPPPRREPPPHGPHRHGRRHRYP
jgi:DNA-binding MarR family transcriptional regulator